MATKKATMPKTINAFTARTHLGRVIKLASEGERFILTKKGRPKVVIMGVEDFEDLAEVAAEQEDKDLQQAIRTAAAQIKRGEVSSLEALKAIYHSKRQ